MHTSRLSAISAEKVLLFTHVSEDKGPVGQDADMYMESNSLNDIVG